MTNRMSTRLKFSGYFNTFFWYIFCVKKISSFFKMLLVISLKSPTALPAIGWTKRVVQMLVYAIFIPGLQMAMLEGTFETKVLKNYVC